MQIAATYLEYLVVGCIGLLWALPLVASQQRDALASHDKFVVLLVPVVYVLGMCVDFVAEQLLSPVKHLIAKRQDDGGLPDVAEDLGYPSSSVFVTFKSPELAKDLQGKSTRDRIARGTWLNLLIATLVYCFRDPLFLDIPRLYLVPACALATGLTFAMWWRFERLSRQFRHYAVATIARAEDPNTASGGAGAA